MWTEEKDILSVRVWEGESHANLRHGEVQAACGADGDYCSGW